MNGSSRYKRLIHELLKLEQLEFKSKFILNDNQMVLSGSSKWLLRFNKTTTPQSFHVKALYVIQGRVFPQTEPYCRASFLIEIILPPEYPFGVPKLIFLDPIYHPNVDESGEHCCGWCLANNEAWTPTTSIKELIEAAIFVIDHPTGDDHTRNRDCAIEYRNDYPTFYEKALKRVLACGRPRY